MVCVVCIDFYREINGSLFFGLLVNNFNLGFEILDYGLCGLW